MIPALHIQLLGAFCLRADDTPIPITSPRVQALLAFLLLHRAAPHPRQQLAFLLWPDSGDAQARTNLRKLVHHLRRTLPYAERFLADDGPTLQWRPDAPWTFDVADFEGAVAHAAQADQVGGQAAARAALEQAVAHYQGPLLPSCYDDWLLPERERLEQVFLAALERLIRLVETAGDHRHAISHAQRLLRHDPLHEATYQQLMRLHAWSGDRTGALRVYRTCTTVLARELGVAPSAATREVYERLLQAELRPSTPDGPLLPSAVARTHTLPLPLTSFIGREHALAAVKDLLASTRLLTLTGSGGSGKTRLALKVGQELVDEFTDGVWLVELAALTDPALVVQAVATALGVREQPGQPLTETLSSQLRARRLLLLLDNCEHLSAACAHMSERLLQRCPHLRMLVTSREALGLTGETTWPVPPLAVPDMRQPASLAVMAQAEAVRLFVERASAALPTFRLTARNAPAVAQICRRLDGIPLAIELAATRVKLLTVDQLAGRLDDCFQLLTGGSRTALPRHQTLRAAIDWSYELLPEPERVVLRRLSVFAGGFTLEAAEIVCAGVGVASGEVLELLAHLIDKSLVLVEESEPGDVTRYRLLETVRQYGRHRLREAGEVGPIQRQHAAFFLVLATQAEPQVMGEQQVHWLGRLETEHDNLRAALHWMIEQQEEELVVRLSGALYRFWEVHGHMSEGRRWFDQVLALLDRAGAATDPTRMALRATALLGAGWLAHDQGDFAQAAVWYEESLVLHRELDNKRGITMLLNLLGILAYDQGDFARARGLYEESLALWRELGDKRGIVIQLNNLGYLAHQQGDHARAIPLLTEALALARAGGEKRGIALTLHSLAMGALAVGDYERAKPWFEQGLTMLRDVGDPKGIALCLEGLAEVAAAEGHPARAARLYGAAETIRTTIGVPLSPTARAHFDRVVAAIRVHIDQAAWDVAWAAGRAMPVEQAIAYALEERPPADPRTDPEPGVAGPRT